MALNDPTLPADHPINKVDDWAKITKKPEPGTFSPKLRKETKCEILALFHREVPIPLLAVAFGVHRRTIGAIVGELSTKYREIRALRDGMGGKAFDTHYITEEGVARCVAARENPEVYKSNRKYEQEKSGAQPNARKHAGRHLIKASEMGYLKDHLIEVVFVRDLVSTGYNDGKPYSSWGFHVLSSDNPDFLHTMQPVSPGSVEVRPFVSSTEAYMFAVNGGITT